MASFDESKERIAAFFSDPKRVVAVAVTIVVLALTAVFTTRSGDEATSLRGGDPATDGGGSVDGDGFTLDDEGEGGSGSAGSGSAGGGTSSGTVSAPGTNGSPGSSGSAAVTDKEIKIGIAYNEDPETGNAAAGFVGIGQVDQKRAWETMIKEVNRTGVAGRKVVPVAYSFTTQDVQTKGAETLAQEMCAHWTQDNKVFMAWAGGGTDTLRGCLTKAKVAQLSGGTGFSYGKTFTDYPWLVEHNTPAQDRMAAFHVDRLHAAGFFSEFKNDAGFDPPVPADGKPRIGLIRYNEPSYRAAATTLKESLANKGLSLCNGCEFEIVFGYNIQDQLAEANQINAAVDNCKSKGCTHMLFLGSTQGVRITIFSVEQMERQRYRPRLGFNTLDAPQAVADLLGAQYYPQFRESVLVGWSPSIDYNLETKGYKACKALFVEAGETFGGTDDTAGNKDNQITAYCDTAWYFRAAMNAAGTAKVSLDSWLTGVHSVEPVTSAGTYVMQTKQGRHDGAGAIRLGAWFDDDDCSCFRPTTGMIPI